MHVSKLFALIIMGLFVRVTLSESCLKEGKNQMEIDSSCKVEKIALLSKKKSFTVKFEAGKGDAKEWKLNLKIGKCEVNAPFVRVSIGSFLNITSELVSLPVIATITKDRIKFVGAGPKQTFEIACDPGFKKVDGGSWFDFSFSMEPEVPGLNLILEEVSLPKKDALMASWVVPTIIFVPILTVFLIPGGLFLVCFLRKRKTKRAKDEVTKKIAPEKPVVKPPIVKVVDQTKKPEVKKQPVKIPKPVSNFLPDSELRTTKEDSMNNLLKIRLLPDKF